MIEMGDHFCIIISDYISTSFFFFVIDSTCSVYICHEICFFYLFFKKLIPPALCIYVMKFAFLFFF